MQKNDHARARVRLQLLAMQRYPWEQGVAMQAFLEAGELETVAAMAREAAYRSLPDGRVAAIGQMDAATDPCACGEGIWAAARHTGEPALLEGHRRLLAWALQSAPRNEQGVCYHLVNRRELWADSMYMLPPYLAAAGHGDAAMLQWRGYYDALHDPATGLMRHMWDDEARTFPRAAFWGGGNGWAVASVARMIRSLPAHRNELAKKGVALIDGLLRYLRPDGLFHDVVDDPNTFVETNLSQMLAYAIYRGLRDGWLPEAYGAAAEILYAAALGKVDEHGLVRDVCGAPTFDKPGVSPEGQAFFILMHTARDDCRGVKRNFSRL